MGFQGGPPPWLLVLAWWPLVALLLAFVISIQTCDPGVFVGDIPLFSNRGGNICRGRADVYLTQTFPAVPRVRATSGSVAAPFVNSTTRGSSSGVPLGGGSKTTFLVAVAVCQEDEAALGWLEGLCARPEANWRVYLYHKVCQFD
jgi:hypothetical protein